MYYHNDYEGIMEIMNKEKTKMKQLKPFNLEQALAGAPVTTRDGTKVIRLIALPEAKPQSRLVAVLEDGETATFNEGGRYYSMRDSSLDLFMAPTKKEGYIATIKIEWEV